MVPSRPRFLQEARRASKEAQAPGAAAAYAAKGLYDQRHHLGALIVTPTPGPGQNPRPSQSLDVRLSYSYSHSLHPGTPPKWASQDGHLSARSRARTFLSRVCVQSKGLHLSVRCSSMQAPRIYRSACRSARGRSRGAHTGRYALKPYLSGFKAVKIRGML